MHESASLSLAQLQRRLRWIGAVAVAAFLGMGLLGVTLWRQPWQSDELRLRSLTIVDEHGVPRVRVGGQLPDAVIDGKSVPRGDEAAGVLIYDAGGQERGGYVTFRRSGNAVLTLDTKKGMVLLLSADSADGAAAKLWGNGFANWLDLRADPTGARLTVVRDHEIVVQDPPMSEADADLVCREIDAEVAQLKTAPPADEVLRACSRNMPITLCRRCLGGRR
ncbi:MAG: hypothetical protein ACKVS8_07735 [Phycisphaerales bacterium]